jgi:hypothetical protein
MKNHTLISFLFQRMCLNFVTICLVTFWLNLIVCNDMNVFVGDLVWLLSLCIRCEGEMHTHDQTFQYCVGLNLANGILCHPSVVMFVNLRIESTTITIFIFCHILKFSEFSIIYIMKKWCLSIYAIQTYLFQV